MEDIHANSATALGFLAVLTVRGRQPTKHAELYWADASRSPHLGSVREVQEEMEPVRLLVADDHEIVRKRHTLAVGSQPGWQVTAEASDGREAVEKAREMKPDVTVLDISMPSLNGLERRAR